MMQTTGRKEELLRAIRAADEQIQLLAQARAEAVAELERIMLFHNFAEI